VRQIVAPGEKVIAPGATIMSYLSGRDVVMSRDILPTSKKETNWPAHLAALNIRYAIFPSQVYRKAERRIRDLMDKQVIVPTERVAKEGDMVLAKVEIKVPPPGQDWRKRPPTTAPMTLKTTASGTRRPSAAQLRRKHAKVAALARVAAKR